MKRRLWALVALSALATGFAPGAHATLLSIGIGAAPTTEATDGGIGFVEYSHILAGVSYTVTATGSPILSEPGLDSTSVSVASSGPKTSYIWVTEQGLTEPVGKSDFISGFTSNTWTGNIVSVVEKTFLSTTDGLYGGTPLASTTILTETTARVFTDLSPNLAAPYSETEEYIISFGGGRSSANDTIDLSTPVPEPVSMALLGVSLFGLGMARRKRQTR